MSIKMPKLLFIVGIIFVGIVLYSKCSTPEVVIDRDIDAEFEEMMNKQMLIAKKEFEYAASSIDSLLEVKFGEMDAKLQDLKTSKATETYLKKNSR